MAEPNRQLFESVISLLAPVLNELVFVGGCTTGIFVTDPAAGGNRPTKDVDAIVDVTSYAQYVALSDRLRILGLAEDTSEGAPLCRWRQGNLIVDVMPTDARVLGFSNRWYPMAIDTAQRMDILPTGYMGAEMCNIKPGDTIAVWGCGPVGLFAIKSAFLLGAERVIAIDRFGYRLDMAREKCGAETLNYEEVSSVPETLKEMTAGRGPDACIDAVGMEAHGHGLAYMYDRTKQALSMETDRPIALREALMACANGGVVSVIGVYGGLIDKFPMGTIMNRSLTIRSGQCHVHRYMRPCWSGSRAVKSIRPWSLRIECRWRMPPRATTSSCTSTTIAKRSSSAPNQLWEATAVVRGRNK